MNPFRTKDGEIVVIQKPNPPLIIAGAFWLLARFSDKQVFTYLFQGSLLVWALMELLQGVNVWRRLLGLAITITTTLNILSN